MYKTVSKYNHIAIWYNYYDLGHIIRKYLANRAREADSRASASVGPSVARLATPLAVS